MRKIEERMVEALQQGKSLSLANTRVTRRQKTEVGNASTVYLHGNLIAVVYWNEHRKGPMNRAYSVDSIDCTLAGWGTVTTRSRLNAICRGFGMASRFGQRKGQQYFDDQRINAEDWVTL